MKFNRKVLDNGLTILHEKRDVPVTTVMIATKYGSGNDSIEEKGTAHFIEHLCFKGTEKRTAKQIAEDIERVGGELNAFTQEEITAYHVKLPSSHLRIAMDVMFDIYFNPKIPEEEVEREGNVICEEIKMYHDSPRAHTLEKIKSNLYNEPFGIFGAGRQEVVKAMKREQLFKRHREIYVPKNTILSVVGNNDFEEVVSLAEEFVVERDGIEVKMPKIDLEIVSDKEKREDLQQTNLALGFHIPFNEKRMRYAAEVFSAILGEGMSSKLFEEVREKRGLVYGIKSDIDIGRDYGYMIIVAGTEPGKVDEVIDVSLAEFEKMANISEEELAAAKVQLIGNRQVDLEDSGDVATNLIFEELMGNARDFYNYADEVNSVTLEDIKKLASINKYASFSIGP